MFNCQAKVLNKKESSVTLEIIRKKACGCCDGFFCQGNLHQVIVNTDFALEIGNLVEIGVDSKQSIILSFIIFLLPSFIFLSIVYFFRENKFLGILEGFIGLVVYFFLLKFFFLKKMFNRQTVVILRKICRNRSKTCP